MKDQLLIGIAEKLDLLSKDEMSSQENEIAEILVREGYLVKSYFPERNETIYAVPIKS